MPGRAMRGSTALAAEAPPYKMCASRSLNSGEKCQPACKPGSVWPRPLRSETWRPFILDACCHAPHATYPGGGPETALKVSPRTAPIRFCSRWGLPCRSRCRSRGGLLPHPFTLAAENRGGLLSVALSLGSPPPAISRHRVSMEPGLSSPAAFRLSLVRPPGRLAGV